MVVLVLILAVVVVVVAAAAALVVVVVAAAAVAAAVGQGREEELERQHLPQGRHPTGEGSLVLHAFYLHFASLPPSSRLRRLHRACMRACVG
jgi:hypothetical protein